MVLYDWNETSCLTHFSLERNLRNIYGIIPYFQSIQKSRRNIMTAQTITRKRSLPCSAVKASRKFCVIAGAPNNSKVSSEEKPDDFIMEALQSRGCQAHHVSFKELDDFFFDPTQEEMAAYRQDVITAVRKQDIETLRKYHEEGRPLKCSNTFGESLLHLACRRGLLDVVTFFIKEAGVPIQVRDDYGRTPLHDACWTVTPNFALMELLIGECPDLLLVKDARGFTPMSYTRKEHWGKWNKFLRSNANMLVPRTIKTSRKQ